jgi:hypothetical protein
MVVAYTPVPAQNSAVPARSPDARCAQRARASARVAEAIRRQPTLDPDRVSPTIAVLREYRVLITEPALPAVTPLDTRIAEVEAELAALEAHVASLPKNLHREGATIRRALCFLKTFGRLSTLDFELIPPEERPKLVKLLRLEYRWCFAAAGTTPRAFKIAIGRTGAR